MRSGCVALGLAAVLAGCAPQAPPHPEAAALPAGFPLADYRSAAAAGAAVYRIEPARSLAVAEVRRGGTLARFGHDHVVAARRLQGYALPAQGRADLALRVDELTVDEAELRAAAGFDTRPSAEDIAATRDNMLGRVLDAAAQPHLSVAVQGLAAADTAGAAVLAVHVTLNGVGRALSVPAQIEQDDRRLRVQGRFELRQRDFGIEPFAVLGGALQVQDALALRFDIEARRWAGD